MPRGSVAKAYQESKLGGNGAVTQTDAAVAECMPRSDWLSSGRVLPLPSTLTHLFLLSQEPGPECSAPKEENF